jgi:hypothetical protein
MLPVGFVLGFFFDLEDGGNMYLQNVGLPSAEYATFYHQSQDSSVVTF